MALFLIGFICVGVLATNAQQRVNARETTLEIQSIKSIAPSRLETITTNGGVEIPILAVHEQDIFDAEELYAQKLLALEKARMEAEAQAILAHQRQVEGLSNYLYARDSPMAPYSELIISSSEQCGVDYRLTMAIAGNESNFGKVGGGYYHNAWGWGPFIRWTSWEESIPSFTCSFARQYVYRGYDSIETLAPRYGAVNQEEWVNNMYWFYNRIP